MTKDEFKSLVEVRRNFDFSLFGRTWMLNVERKSDGGSEILFGEQYGTPEHYENFTHLMADARVGSKFLREALIDIQM
ncbi:hypothetical protein [Treponema sp.]|uniref:hypothetical protein n=1 Tax=Treponema sp. TaxID=166 RepID=UPI0025DFEE41|nr:hypothetical protein [Treponema sp.]MCR5218932.1 hypothetical protein [Treponema sp.]